MSISATQIAAVASGLGGELGTVEQGLESKLENTQLPLFGATIGSAIEQGQAALTKIHALQAGLSTALSALQDGADHPLSTVAVAINDALSNAGFSGVAQVTVDGNGALAVAISSSENASYSQTLASDLGVGNLGLSTAGTAEVDLGYQVGLTATVDGTGHFSLSTPGGGPAASITLNASAPTFQGDTHLGFLNFTTQDKGSSLASSFAIDAAGNVTANASADVALHIGADLQNASFPSVSADVAAHWGLGASPTVSFNDVSFDFGSFVNNFIDPILNRLDPFLAPLHELAAVLNTTSRRSTALPAFSAPTER
jgi:hypothetical protein